MHSGQRGLEGKDLEGSEPKMECVSCLQPEAVLQVKQLRWQRVQGAIGAGHSDHGESLSRQWPPFSAPSVLHIACSPTWTGTQFPTLGGAQVLTGPVGKGSSYFLGVKCHTSSVPRICYFDLKDLDLCYFKENFLPGSFHNIFCSICWSTSGTPIVLVLDLCYLHLWAAFYMALCLPLNFASSPKEDFQGIVLCSNCFHEDVLWPIIVFIIFRGFLFILF